MSTVIRVRLNGGEAALGRVGAGDVARVLLGVEHAVARAAGHVIGRRVKASGRRGRTIEQTTRFRLVGIESGSVVGVLELPEERAEDQLDFDVPSLGQLALESALATAAGEETEHLDVAEAFVRLADEIGLGSRYADLTLEQQRPAGCRAVTLDRGARDRLWELISWAPSEREDALVGVLVEADFENDTARLRTAAGHRVVVRFEPELADDIHEGLRRQAELIGEVTYDPGTLEARSVRLRRIVRSEQLAIGLEPGGFWVPRDIDELASHGGIAAVEDVEALRDAEASDDEVDGLLAALDEM